MGSILLAVIYLIFISLGLPDSLLGSGWPVMQGTFGVPSSYAGYVSMTISFMTIISALLSPRFIKRFHTKWIAIFSIFLTIQHWGQTPLRGEFFIYMSWCFRYR